MKYDEILEQLDNLSDNEIKSNSLFECVGYIEELTYFNDPNERSFEISFLEEKLSKINIKIDFEYSDYFDLYEKLIEKINSL